MRISFISCLIFLSLNLSAQPPLTRLSSAIRALDLDPEMQSANWSMSVIDAGTGKVLIDHNGSRSLATASTMKAITTITAFEVLGTDFRFKTEIAYSGVISEDGILKGDLIIKGDGDPTLGSDRFGKDQKYDQLMHKWALELKKLGINRIEGNVIGDGSIFSTQLTPAKWPWEDMGNYYGAGAAGLNIYENLYYLDLRPGSRIGSRTEVLRTTPQMVDLVFFNEIKTASSGSGDNGYIYGAPYTGERYLRGTIPAGRSSFTIKGSISDPVWYCAYLMKEELNACEIIVTGEATSIRRLRNAGKRTSIPSKSLFFHYSPGLDEIIGATNTRSINLYAEALAKRVAVALGKAGGTGEAMDAIEKYWKTKGILTEGMYLRDGAGLSPNNSLSTIQMTKILQYAKKAGYYQVFKEGLPRAGYSGSLKRMLVGTVGEGRVWAKSGYISGVRGYAGYAVTVNGQELIFAMIANNYSCSAGAMRRKFERLMVRMVEGV